MFQSAAGGIHLLLAQRVLGRSKTHVSVSGWGDTFIAGPKGARKIQDPCFSQRLGGYIYCWPKGCSEDPRPMFQSAAGGIHLLLAQRVLGRSKTHVSVSG